MGLSKYLNTSPNKSFLLDAKEKKNVDKTLDEIRVLLVQFYYYKYDHKALQENLSASMQSKILIRLGKIMKKTSFKANLFFSLSFGFSSEFATSPAPGR